MKLAVSEAPGARVIGPPLTETIGSVTVMPLRVTLPIVFDLQ